MIAYQELLSTLKELADDTYQSFHKRLLKNDGINVIGVKVPYLRKIAKGYKCKEEILLSFPDEYYEVTFIKLLAVSQTEYNIFVKYSDRCVALIDNWATCDSFAAKCILENRHSYLSYVKKYLSVDGEFYQRYALTTLLHFYVEKEYLDLISELLKRADTAKYFYVHMAAAWLTAEILVKYFEYGVRMLKTSVLDRRTYNKAICKARESFRLSPEQKNFLKELKQ